MGIKDFEINFKMIKDSKKISCERKKILFTTFLHEIDEIFFKAPDYKNKPEQEEAENLYSRIQNYLNKK